ncbi:MAG: iron-sulfur cluster assembly accessory protein [Pseudomonadota bacterium]
MTISDAAATRALSIMGNAEDSILGLRVSISTKGCSGHGYIIEYAKEKRNYEEVIEDKGVKIFIDPAAVMFLIGAEMDFQETTFESGFIFHNPNEKSRCGCGKSFSI